MVLMKVINSNKRYPRRSSTISTGTCPKIQTHTIAVVYVRRAYGSTDARITVLHRHTDHLLPEAFRCSVHNDTQAHARRLYNVESSDYLLRINFLPFSAVLILIFITTQTPSHNLAHTLPTHDLSVSVIRIPNTSNFSTVLEMPAHHNQQSAYSI